VATNTTSQVLILPGMGGDHRMCDLLLPLPGNCVTPDYIPWQRGESLHDYATRFLACLEGEGLIERSQLRTIVGISLGGPIVSEIAAQLKSRPRLILVGSFLSTSELAWYAKIFVRIFAPILPLSVYRAAGRALPFLMRRISRVPESQLALLQDMYMHTPPHFLPRACTAIAHWPGAKQSSHTVRIHGEDDHIIPLRRSSKVDFRVKGAKHLVSISHVHEVRALLTKLLHDL
jgi:pimeloyl-ACP methyl ester carboxylesterase